MWIETLLYINVGECHYVTPFTGVWIETVEVDIDAIEADVTPFTGVWIETVGGQYIPLKMHVTPFTGVWIETVFILPYFKSYIGHTLHGCVD